VEAAGVGRVERVAVAGEYGGCGGYVAVSRLRSVQVVAQVGGDDGDRAGDVEQGGQQGGDDRRWPIADDNGENGDR